MKFSVLALSVVLAVATAADTTTANPSIITSTPEVECAKRCEAKDICCIASCYHVPCPSDDQANDTNECVAACPQGTGSPADTQRYAECERSCYSSHFWGGNGSGATATHSSTTGTGSTATQTSSNSSTTGSKSSDDNDSNDNDGSSSSGTATSSSDSSQETTNAAANVKLGASAAGLFGLVVAAFAL